MVVIASLVLALLVHPVVSECPVITCGEQTGEGVPLETTAVASGREIRERLDPSTCTSGAVGVLGLACGASASIRCDGASSVVVTRNTKNLESPVDVTLVAYCAPPTNGGLVLPPSKTPEIPYIPPRTLYPTPFQNLLPPNLANLPNMIKSKLNPLNSLLLSRNPLDMMWPRGSSNDLEQ